MGDLRDWLDGIAPADLGTHFAAVDAEEIARMRDRLAELDRAGAARSGGVAELLQRPYLEDAR